jgi:PAS domain S-box-containing protein
MTLEDIKDSLSSIPIPESSTEVIRVLHIDDDDTAQMFLKVFIEGDPIIKVNSAQTAEDAIQLIQTGAYDCLVSDYDMPGMDGITLAGKIREISNIPIIIYTGRGSEEVAERAFEAGIDDYIRKEMTPAHYQLVSKRIRQAVERRRSGESYRNLFDNANDGIIVHTIEGVILDINEVQCKRLGHQKKELLGKHLSAYVSPQKISFDKNLKKLLRRRHSTFETVQLTRDGGRIPVEVSAQVIKYMGFDAVLSFSRDISDRKRLESKMKERLEALQSHAVNLGDCEDVNAVARTTYKILHDVMGYSFFGLGIVDGDKLRFVPDTILNDDWDLEYPIDGPGICAKVVRTGSAFNVPDVRLDPDYFRPKSGYKYLSNLVVPIKIGGSVIAVLNVEDEKLNRFTRDDERLLEIFSEHVASSLQRIKMLKETRRHISRIETINKHALHLTTLNKVEEVADYSLNVLQELLGFTYGCFKVVERDLGYLTIPDLPLGGKGISVRAARTGESQLVLDTRLDPDFVSDCQVEYLSELDVPVKVDDRVVAVINLEDSKTRFFDVEDRELVEVLANNVSSALSRIEQLNVIKSSEERQKLLLDSAPEGVTVNVLEKIVYANQSFAEMMGYTIEEILQKKVLDLTRENYKKLTRDMTKRRQAGEKVQSRYDVELIRKNGSFIPVEYSVSRISYGGEYASLTFIRDISSKWEKEELQSKLAALHSHARELNELQSVEDVSEVTLDILHRHMNCNLLSLRVSDGENLTMLGRWGASPIEGVLSIQGKGLMSRVAREKKTIMVNDTHGHPDFLKGSTESQSELAVPIFYKGELLGVLNAESLEINAFTKNDLILMETLADEVGSAFIRIRSLEQVNIYNGKLVALSNHALRLAKCSDLSTVAKVTLDTIHEIIGADLSSFAQVSEGKLNFIYETGVIESQRTELPLEGPGVTVKAAKTGVTQLISDTRFETGYLGSKDSKTVYLSELAVPVKNGDEVKAILNLESERVKAFTGEDVKILTIFAEHVASAMTRIEQIEKICSSEEKYRNILDSSLDSVFLFSGTKLLYGNKKMAEVLGYDDVSTLIGMDLMNFLPENEKGKIRQRALSRQRGEPQSDSLEFSLIRKDGAIMEVEASVSLTEYEYKPAVLAIARDISERKRYQTKLTQLHGSAEKLAGAITRDAVWDIVIETVSQILGFDFAGIAVLENNSIRYVRSVGDVLPENWRVDLSKPSITSRAFETCTPQLIVDTALDPDYMFAPGTVRRGSELASPIIVNGKPIALLNIESDKKSAFSEADLSLIQILIGQVASALDRITHNEEKRSREETRQRELVNEMERMSGMVRHDLARPLQTIQSASYLLRHKPDRMEELTQRIDDSVEYAVKILDDLRNMTKPEVLNKILTNLSVLVETSIINASIPVTVSVVKKLVPLSLDVDQYRIRRVVDNLIKNAVEAMPDGGKLTLNLRATAGVALLTVGDSGRGITEEAGKNLFTPFYTTKPTGTGLGLAICKRIVEAHGGRITFESRIGEGTTFSVVLPLSSQILIDAEDHSFRVSTSV